MNSQQTTSSILGLKHNLIRFALFFCIFGNIFGQSSPPIPPGWSFCDDGWQVSSLGTCGIDPERIYSATNSHYIDMADPRYNAQGKIYIIKIEFPNLYGNRLYTNSYLTNQFEGPISDYFEENSYGQYSLDVIGVHDWVMMPETWSTYKHNLKKLMKDAFAGANIPFGSLDTNGDHHITRDEVSFVLMDPKSYMNVQGNQTVEVDHAGTTYTIKSNIAAIHMEKNDYKWSLDYYKDGHIDHTQIWALPYDIPVVGDFNNDYKDDIIVYRPNKRKWMFDFDKDGNSDHSLIFGEEHQYPDKLNYPVVGDFNNDGTDDLITFFPPTRRWLIDLNFDGIQDYSLIYGNEDDIPLMGDYNDDGWDDLIVFRPSNGNWYIDTDRNGTVDASIHYGTMGDRPVIADYNSDGTDDLIVFRSSTGEWIIDTDKDGSSNIRRFFGSWGNWPLVGDYDGNLTQDFGLFGFAEDLFSSTSFHVPSHIHELAHALFGMPDRYDSACGSGMTGKFDLMSYTCGWVHMNIFDKMKIGWIQPSIITPQNLTENACFAFPSANLYPEALVLYDPILAPDEFWIIENKHKSSANYGFDNGLIESGLAVWWSNLNTDEVRLVDFNQPDQLPQLYESQGSGALFKYKTGQSAGNKYTLSSSDGTPLFSLHSISQPGATMYASVSYEQYSQSYSQSEGQFWITNEDIPSFASTWLQTSGVKVIPGDFTGDGFTDYALVRQETGWHSIPMAISDGCGGFNWTNYNAGNFVSNWAHKSGVEVIAGHFNGDEKMDLALVRQQAGWQSIPMAISNGDGSFQIYNPHVGDFIGIWANQSDTKLVPGDYNGDGMTDFALVDQGSSNGLNPASIRLAICDGNEGFSIHSPFVGNFITNWAHQSGVEVVPGDYDGDGTTDLALVRQDSGWGSIPIAFSLANGQFNVTNHSIPNFISNWAHLSGVKLVPGDYDGDGRTDLALVRQAAGWGSLPVAFSQGNGQFSVSNASMGGTINLFNTFAYQSGVKVVPGDYDGDGNTDIALIRQESGWDFIPVAFSDGDGTFTQAMETVPRFIDDWAPTAGVEVYSGDFNGDGNTDLSLIRHTSGWNSIPMAFGNNRIPNPNPPLRLASGEQEKVIDSEEQTSEILVYPNPSSEIIRVDHLQPGSLLFLHSLQGQILKKIELGAQTHSKLNLGSLTPGTYLLRVHQPNQEIVVKKVVKL